MVRKMWIICATSLVFSFLFVYVFGNWYEGRGIAEGARCSLLMNVVGMFDRARRVPDTLRSDDTVVRLRHDPVRRPRSRGGRAVQAGEVEALGAPGASKIMRTPHCLINTNYRIYPRRQTDRERKKVRGILRADDSSNCAREFRRAAMCGLHPAGSERGSRGPAGSFASYLILPERISSLCSIVLPTM